MATWQEIKEAWRVPLPDLDAFESLLESTYELLDLESTYELLDLDGDPALAPGQRDVKRYLPSVQISLLTIQLPTFLPVLDQGSRDRVKSIYAPAKTSRLSRRRQVALTTFRTLPIFFTSKPPVPLPRQVREFALEVMAALVRYRVDDVYWAVHATDQAFSESSKQGSARSLDWEDAVGALVGVPAKVSNAMGRWKTEGMEWEAPEPDVLSSTIYFDNLIQSFETLLYDLSQSRTSPAPLLHLLQRLGSLGLFPPTPRDDRAPSFWKSFLPAFLVHLDATSPAYPDDGYLARFFLALPASTFNPLVDSLLHHLTWNIESLSPDSPSGFIARVGHVLTALIGPAERGGAFEAVLRSLLGAKCTMTDVRACGMIRGIVAWIGLSDEHAKVALLQEVMNAWTDPKYIRFALYGQQFALTYTLLLSISLLDPFHPQLVALSHRARFLTAMQTYLSHQDASVRRLGMLAAEIISERTIEETGDAGGVSEKEDIEALKAGLEGEESRPPPRGGRRLRFGPDMWEGEGQGKDEARWLRRSVGVRDANSPSDGIGWDAAPVASTQRSAERGRRTEVPEKKPQGRPKIVMLDDEQAEDRLEGYDAPSPSSSRSPSPTPSYLEQVAADPSLALDAVQRKKITRPVYIAQLVALVKDRETPEAVEMALKHGESLIRAKRSFGGELEENAVELASMVIALDDPFHLDDFDEKRQGMLNALVACSPRNVAPYMSEVYFTGQFSLRKRIVILTALSMGARELAGLYTPLPASTRRVDFPSKTLPPALHRKYAVPEDFTVDSGRPGQLEAAAEALRGQLLGKTAQTGDTIPDLARQRQLRVTKRGAERGTLMQMEQRQASPVVPFQDVAAEYFILPLINHFWTYFNDATTREDRARARGDRYRAAGTGLVLSPLALEKMLITLVLLLHAARHSPLYLAVLAPEALELALGVATRHRAAPDVSSDQPGQGDHMEQGAEAGVVSAALELCLVVLDTSVELDRGRMVVTTKPGLVAAVGEWAGAVFKAQEGGAGRLGGQGGVGEGKVRTTAAGVVVKVSEIAERWGRYDIV